jgi:CD2 antigen cytoplasmic tail-binding protein 2
MYGERTSRINFVQVEGQEEATEEYDGNIKITPFNMKEEEEEGHFDAMGSYVFDKTKEDIHDAWLDNIDWSRVKKDAGTLCGHVCTLVLFAGKHWTGTTAAVTASLGDEPVANDDDDNLVTMPSSITPAHVIELYTQIHAVLASSHETVTQALKRLGGSVSAADARKARWAAKKANAASVGKCGKAVQQINCYFCAAPSPVTRLTGLVDTLVANGEFEAYSYTKEKLAAEIEKRNNLTHFGASAAKAKSVDELDIFADKIDQTDDKMDSSQETTTSSTTAVTNDDSTKWEFKWENTADAPVQGPASSQQMHVG